MGYFGPGKGKIYMTRINCKGDETSLMQCPMIFEPDGFQQGTGNTPAPRYRNQWRHTASYHYRYSSCWSHNDDAAIQCFTSGLRQTYKHDCTGDTPKSTAQEHYSTGPNICTAQYVFYHTAATCRYTKLYTVLRVHRVP